MEQLLVIENLKKCFQEADHRVFAVNGVSFGIDVGETVGLVGESGCGKTTVARCITKLTSPTKGRIFFQGIDITSLSEKEFKPLRKQLQMVFQDPTLSLNPRFTVKRTLSEPLKLHHLVSNGEELKDKLLETMSIVGLEKTHLGRFPHQLSGGQKQRVGIARAVISHPKCVILDEPTASLDMNIRIYILDLLRRLQRELRMTYLFISHDLSTIRYLCDKVVVMYAGKIVETAPANEIFTQPQHPYTKALFSAVPIPDPDVQNKRIILPGETPSLTVLPTGCVFKTRCYLADSRCDREEPHFEKMGHEHHVACFKV